jgi:hypothetical protein
MVALGVAAALLGAGAGACGGPSYPHRPFPQVDTLDGSRLSPLRLVTIVAANEPQGSTLFDFSRALVSSAWWRQLSGEYHLGAASAAASLTGPAIMADVTDHDVFEYIRSAVATAGGPPPDGNTLYLLYLPAGVTVIGQGVPNTDCAMFGAYHAPYGTRGDNLAVVQQCSGPYPLEDMTTAASHEIIEAATDPDGNGYALPSAAAHEPWTESVWNVPFGNQAELADLCEGTFYVENGLVYQRVWSNAAAAGGGDPCIPALHEPFYDVAFDQDWYPVAAGAAVSIPVRGWATGTVSPWGIEADLAGPSGFSAMFAGGAGTIQDGGHAELVVSAPPGAPSGSYAVVLVASIRPPAAFGAAPLTDGAHLVPVGVYVP